MEHNVRYCPICGAVLVYGYGRYSNTIQVLMCIECGYKDERWINTKEEKK